MGSFIIPRRTFEYLHIGSCVNISFHFSMINIQKCNCWVVWVSVLISKVMLKILQARYQQFVNRESPDIQIGFRKAEESEIKLPTSVGSSKKQESSRKTSTSALLIMSKPLDCVDHNKMWKILKEMGIPDLACLLRNLYAGQEATVKPDMGQHTGSKLGKEYVKALYCHPACLTYMQSTSCEMLGWVKHKLESRLPGEVSITSDMQMTPPLWKKVKKN